MVLRQLILSIFLFLSFSLEAQNPFGFKLQNGAKMVELPFRKESNLIIIPIKINGNGPYDFIFDTGSETGLVFEKNILVDYNLTEARRIPVYAKKGVKLTELIVANNLSISLNGISGVNQTMLVLQEDIIDVHNVIGFNVYGVLGSELFNQFVVEINYTEQKIKLHDPASFTKPKKFKAIPIEIINFRPYVRVKLGQKGNKAIDVKLLIDTGASSALFLDESNNEEIKLPKKTINISLGRGLAGTIEGKIGRVQKIKLGSYRFSNITTSYPNDWKIGSENLKIIDKSKIRYGTLGADILSRFHVIFDYLNSTMYLKKNENFGNSFDFNTVGLNIMATGQDLNEYIVSEIITGSQADKAGIKIGDEIISLNGRPAFYYSLTDVNNMLREKPGTLLTIILRRDNDLFKKTIRQKRLL